MRVATPEATLFLSVARGQAVGCGKVESKTAISHTAKLSICPCLIRRLHRRVKNRSSTYYRSEERKK